MKKDPNVFIGHIFECIELIEENTKIMSQKEFLKNITIQDAVLRRLEIIGEAMRHLPEDLKKLYPNIPWKDIMDMRNKLIHEYFGVDLELVWDVVKKDIPILKKELKKIKS